MGHTSVNSKGRETRYYVCGNRYRTHTCKGRNINADELEAFVIQQLKAYLQQVDFDQEALHIADQINGSSPDLTEERRELADVTAKINNGLKAILGGVDFKELRDEMDRLRIRKSELEDIIGRRTASRRQVDPRDIVRVFEDAVSGWDDNLPQIIKQLVTKIYAHTDGTISVNVGVHMIGGGRGI